MEFLRTFMKEEDGFLGALISGVTSLIGQKKQFKHENEQEALKFVRLRQGAEAAGFNPLTALENGGLSSGGGGSTPKLASAELLAGAVTGAIDHFTKQKEDEKAAAQQKENELLAVQVEQGRSGVTVPKQTLKTRRQAATAVTNVQTASQGERTVYRLGAPTPTPPPFKNVPYQEGEPAFDKAGNPLTPALTLNGKILPTDPDTSDAEIVEQRYGDIAQEFFGLHTLWRDFDKNYPTIGDKFGAAMRPFESTLPPLTQENQTRKEEALKARGLSYHPFAFTPRNGPRQRAETVTKNRNFK